MPIGVTGVIQQPGLGNVLGQSIGGIAQMLQQIEAMKQEQAKNAAYNAYMQELTTASEAKRTSDAAAATQQAANERTLGGALRDYLTPQQQAVNFAVPTGLGGDLQNTVNVPRERGMQEILATLPPELVGDFVKTVEPTEKTRQQKQEEARAQRAMRSYLNTLPAPMRPMMEAIVRLEEGGVPANLSQFVVSRLSQEVGKDPKAIAALRKKYPELANLPDTEVVERAAMIATEEAKRRLGLDRPRVVGGGTPAPTGRTAKEVKDELSAINSQVTTSRMLAREAGERPRHLMTPTGKPINTDSAAVAAFQADSAAAANDLKGLIAQQRGLFQELQQVQGAPGTGGGQVYIDPASGRRYTLDAVGTVTFIDPPRQ